MKNKQKILDKFLNHVGLFENVFGKITDLIVYNTDKEKAKRLLFSLYNKKDVHDLFPPELDTEKVEKTLNTLFTYHEHTDDGAKRS